MKPLFFYGPNWQDSSAFVVTHGGRSALHTVDVLKNGNLASLDSFSYDYCTREPKWKEISFAEALGRLDKDAVLPTEFFNLLAKITQMKEETTGKFADLEFTFFHDGSIKAGCTTLTSGDVNEIIRLRNKAYN